MLEDVRLTHAAVTGKKEVDEALLTHTLHNSYGLDTMTPEDMKIAIVALRGMVMSQGALLDVLCQHLLEDPNETPLDKLKALLKK